MMRTTVAEYVAGYEEKLHDYADPIVAEGAAAYMGHVSAFVGVKATHRREAMKEFLQSEGLPSHAELPDFVRLCWDRPYREMQYFGMEVVQKLMKKAAREDIEIIEFMVVNKSWWDTVDFIAAHLAGAYFRAFGEEICGRTRQWMNSCNIWLQRSALLFQLHWKEQTDVALLFEYVEELSGVKEFFIEKAIGWALRQLSRTYPEEVRQFVETHTLRPLSRREALRLLIN
jgi:3-methyladenine DNA glycosylase AlkD